MSGIFQGILFALDLSNNIGFKEKAAIKSSILSNGGKQVYMINKKTDYLLVSPSVIGKGYSSKLSAAAKYNVPVVNVSYVKESDEAHSALPIIDFLLQNPAERVPGTSHARLDDIDMSISTVKLKTKRKFQKSPDAPPPPVIVYPHGSPDGPNWPETYDLILNDVLQKDGTFFDVELHACNKHTSISDSRDAASDGVSQSTFSSTRNEHRATQRTFRIFTHEGRIRDLERLGEDAGKKECRFLHDIHDAQALYVSLYQNRIRRGFKRVSLLSSSKIGSRKAQEEGNRTSKGDSTLSPQIQRLVNYIYAEASSRLSDAISSPLGTLTLEQIEKGEAILMQIQHCLHRTTISDDGHDDDDDDTGKRPGGSPDELAQLSKSFYSSVPHRVKDAIDNVVKLERMQELVQLMKDMLEVDEVAGDTSTAEVDMKYRALRCNIEHLPEDDKECADVLESVMQSQVEDKATRIDQIHHVYRVSRPVEREAFVSRDVIGNHQPLYHGSKISNWVGILSRGILLPRAAVVRMGGTRTDAGMLGAGIYFGSAATTAVQYCTAGSEGTRLMLVCQVALGKSCRYTRVDTTLTSAPEGYQSVHGVRSTPVAPTDFQDDEYVIYDPKQQHMAYLVEYSVRNDSTLAQPTTTTTIAPKRPSNGSAAAFVGASPSLSTTPLRPSRAQSDMIMAVEDGSARAAATALDGTTSNAASSLGGANDNRAAVNDEGGNEAAGLMVSGGAALPLKSVAVRAELVDLVGKVVVLQHYRNDGTEPVEAKYVFPLDEMAAVCGFEAFINGKHIVGQVKEKEKAHKEYKEAVAAGHGAYLMDEEKPDVFTVSVGNLPPTSDVLIKITYVTELSVDGPNVCFVLPASVAANVERDALSSVTQHVTRTLEAGSSSVVEGALDLQVSVEMPREIVRIATPSHPGCMRVKQTATKATIELLEGTTMQGRPFVLLVGVDKPYEPRMWVEVDGAGHYAAMVAFYPRFEFDEAGLAKEITFLVDRSSSMRGDPMEDVKRTLGLCLDMLPRDATFNVIGFGDTFERLFVAPRRCTEAAAVSIARRYVSELRANFGGTELWRPLKSVLHMGDARANVLRNVFVFTDGMSTNVPQVVDLIRQHSAHTRVFAFGFGEACSRHVVRTIARIGGGRAEFMPPKKLPSRARVQRQFSRAFQPSLSEIAVTWHNSDQSATMQAPNQLTSLYSGERQVVYGFASFCTQATLSARCEDTTVNSLVHTHELGFTKGSIIHTLAARAMIRDYEDGNYDDDRLQHDVIKMRRKQEIIRLSIEYSLVTKFTSFVAVEERDQEEKSTPPHQRTKGPSIEQLIASHQVDQLDTMGWPQEGTGEKNQKDAMVTALQGARTREECRSKASEALSRIKHHSVAQGTEEHKKMLDTLSAGISSITSMGVELEVTEQKLLQEAIDLTIQPLVRLWEELDDGVREAKSSGRWADVRGVKQRREKAKDEAEEVANRWLRVLEDHGASGSSSDGSLVTLSTLQGVLHTHRALLEPVGSRMRKVHAQAAEDALRSVPTHALPQVHPSSVRWSLARARLEALRGDLSRARLSLQRASETARAITVRSGSDDGDELAKLIGRAQKEVERLGAPEHGAKTSSWLAMDDEWESQHQQDISSSTLSLEGPVLEPSFLEHGIDQKEFQSAPSCDGLSLPPPPSSPPSSLKLLQGLRETGMVRLDDSFHLDGSQVSYSSLYTSSSSSSSDWEGDDEEEEDVGITSLSKVLMSGEQYMDEDMPTLVLEDTPLSIIPPVPQANRTTRSRIGGALRRQLVSDKFGGDGVGRRAMRSRRKATHASPKKPMLSATESPFFLDDVPAPEEAEPSASVVQAFSKAYRNARQRWSRDEEVGESSEAPLAEWNDGLLGLSLLSSDSADDGDGGFGGFEEDDDSTASSNSSAGSYGISGSSEESSSGDMGYGIFDGDDAGEVMLLGGEQSYVQREIEPWFAMSRKYSSSISPIRLDTLLADQKEQSVIIPAKEKWSKAVTTGKILSSEPSSGAHSQPLSLRLEDLHDKSDLLQQLRASDDDDSDDEDNWCLSIDADKDQLSVLEEEEEEEEEEEDMEKYMTFCGMPSEMPNEISLVDDEVIHEDFSGFHYVPEIVRDVDEVTQLATASMSVGERKVSDKKKKRKKKKGGGKQAFFSKLTSEEDSRALSPPSRTRLSMVSESSMRDDFLGLSDAISSDAPAVASSLSSNFKTPPLITGDVFEGYMEAGSADAFGGYDDGEPLPMAAPQAPPPAPAASAPPAPPPGPMMEGRAMWGAPPPPPPGAAYAPMGGLTYGAVQAQPPPPPPSLSSRMPTMMAHPALPKPTPSAPSRRQESLSHGLGGGGRRGGFGGGGGRASGFASSRGRGRGRGRGGPSGRGVGRGRSLGAKGSSAISLDRNDRGGAYGARTSVAPRRMARAAEAKPEVEKEVVKGAPLHMFKAIDRISSRKAPAKKKSSLFAPPKSKEERAREEADRQARIAARKAEKEAKEKRRAEESRNPRSWRSKREDAERRKAEERLKMKLAQEVEEKSRAAESLVSMGVDELTSASAFASSPSSSVLVGKKSRSRRRGRKNKKASNDESSNDISGDGGEDALAPMVYVRTSSGRTLRVEIPSDDRVDTLKAAICRKEGSVTGDDVQLSHEGTLLKDGTLLKHGNVRGGATLVLMHVPHDAHEQLLRLQTPSGCWKLTEELCNVLQVPLDVAETTLRWTGAESHPSYPRIREMFATALSLAYLEIAQPHTRGKWEGAAGKARTWLSNEEATSIASQLDVRPDWEGYAMTFLSTESLSDAIQHAPSFAGGWPADGAHGVERPRGTYIGFSSSLNMGGHAVPS